MTTVKFCGLTRPEDAALAAALGATHAGVILTESPRQVDAEKARRIFAEAPELEHVGVFRRREVSEILDDAELAGLDVLQLHGSFHVEDIAALREGFRGGIWTVIPVERDGSPLALLSAETVDMVDAVLLDTSVRGGTGGTGITFDWEEVRPFAQELGRQSSLVVAGGLTASNVADMIRILRPDIADVSSGVESAPGIKDPRLMAAFAEAVASASMV